MKKTLTLFLMFFLIVLLNACNKHASKTKQPNPIEVDSTVADDDEYFQHYEYYSKLIERLETDTMTMTLPPAEFVDTTLVKVATSDDGMLRTYSWDTERGGTMICWGNVIQYRYNGKIITSVGSLDDLITPEEEEVMNYGSYIYAIYNVKTDNGQTVYLLAQDFVEMSCLSYGYIDAVILKKDRLEPYYCFYENLSDDYVIKKDYGDQPVEFNSSDIGIEYDAADLYYKHHNSEHWSDLFCYDKKLRNLYFADAIDVKGVTFPSISGRYGVFHFNGKGFDYIGEDGGFWLHPSIRSFKYEIQYFETKDYKIRIDELFDGTYRYTCWKINQKESEMPNLILYNGRYNEKTYTYNFKGDDNYVYEVSKAELVVKRNKKVLLKQREVL